MADKQAKIDGDITMDAIRRRCQVEQGVIFQITSIKALPPEAVGNNVLLSNLAEFKLKDDGVLRKLKFVDVKDKSDTEIDKIIEEMKVAGQTLLCKKSKIIASKNETAVLVFGKN